MDSFIEALQGGDYWIAAVIAAITISVNLPKIIDFVHLSRKRRINDLTKAISDENISNELRAHLKDEIEVEHFRIVHSVKVSKVLLDAMLILKHRVDGKLSFRHILRVAKLVPDIDDIDSISYRVELSWFERVSGVYNLVAGIILILFSVFIVCSSLLASLPVKTVLLGVIFFPIGGFMINEGASIISAMYINRALDQSSGDIEG